jgi:hypothetical protein
LLLYFLGFFGDCCFFTRSYNVIVFSLLLVGELEWADGGLGLGGMERQELLWLIDEAAVDQIYHR